MYHHILNYLNPYLCELVTFYYVWKNQIKSDYVGFCHYRRFFKKIDINELHKNKVHYLGYVLNNINQMAINNELGFNKYYCNLLYTYLKSLNIFDENILYEYFYTKKEIRIPYCISYIIEWNLFNKFCEITFGFLENILHNYKDINIYKNVGRKYAWIFEIICGIILSLLTNNKKPPYTNWEINYQKAILLKSYNIDIEKIRLFIHKNNRTEADIYILCDNKDDLSKYLYKSEYEVNSYIINNISEIPDYKIVIELNINQYIKCKDPEDFNLNKYTIENIK